MKQILIEDANPEDVKAKMKRISFPFLLVLFLLVLFLPVAVDSKPNSDWCAFVQLVNIHLRRSDWRQVPEQIDRPAIVDRN